MLQRLLIILIIAASVFSGCNSNEKSTDTKRVKVVATTGMIGDALHNILDTLADVQSLMGPGVDPHLYKATQGDLKRLNDADIIVYNGLHLEGKMVEIFHGLRKSKTVFSMEDMIPKEKLIEVQGFGGNYDPHIWFDVSLWREANINLGIALADTLANFSGEIKSNSLIYSNKLNELDSFARIQISAIPIKNRVLITAHDAFEYFGRAYNIQVRGLQGISTMSEAGIRDISDLVDFLSKNKIPAVFVETSVSRRAIDAVVEGCRLKGHHIVIGGSLYSDALGEENTEEGTYIGTVRANVNTIVESLNK